MEIPCTTQSLKKKISKAENAFSRYNLHTELLKIYKQNKKTPKGLALKFNLSLCPTDKQLIKETNRILKRSSMYLQESLIKATTRHITKLQSEKDNLKNKLKHLISNEDFNSFITQLRTTQIDIQTRIKARQESKFQRDNIHPIMNPPQQNKHRKFKRKKRIQHFATKRKNKKEAIKTRKQFAIQQTPDQNAINLTDHALTEGEKSILRKGPSFVPSPTDVDWCSLRKDFDSFVNKLRYQVKNNYDNNNNQIQPTPMDSHPPITKSQSSANYRCQPSKSNALEAFIDAVESNIFSPNKIRKIHSNITPPERQAMKKITEWEDKTVRLQDKGGRFVILKNEDYVNKVNDYITKSHLTEVDTDLSNSFNTEVTNWIDKWNSLRKLPKEWATFIKTSNPKPGTMYGLIKTHKPNNTNPVRTISSGCGTSIENLSIYVESHLAPLTINMPSRIKDTSHMLDIIDTLNDGNLPANSILASLDIVNMFPNIDNTLAIRDITAMLNSRTKKNPPTTCIIEALLLCLQSNNTSFNKKNFLQTDGTAQGPHMACSYSDLAMARYDKIANETEKSPLLWVRFRDDVFMIWILSIEELHEFVSIMNNADPTGKLKYELKIADENGLNLLDLKLKFNITTRSIEIDVYAKPTNSFSYVDSTTCYSQSNIRNIPYGIGLRLRRICDDDNKFEKRASEYSNYLIARNYKPNDVDRQFNKVRNITRAEARQPKIRNANSQTTKNAFITTYNPILPNFHKIINDKLHILHSDPKLVNLFPTGSIKPIYRRSKNLKEILSPSAFPKKSSISTSSIAYCNRCDICKNFINPSPNFTSTVTNRTYMVKGNITCNSVYVIYLVTCKKCKHQYVGSTNDYKKRMRGHKSDNHLNKSESCGVAKHFNTTSCKHPAGANKHFSTQVIECVHKHTEEDLLRREQYWQAQLFTIHPYGMNSTDDWYSTKRKGYRR